ncbi:MAG TPA: uroporphyrinogen decarboxylase family protein [Planctomycetota bacterium]|nr:uroporphyrinogen decarboxylase family protein [Planctomycetota bacterium]
MTENTRLALDTILRRPTRGIPTWMLHIMEHSTIERLAGAASGEYRRDPSRVYLAMQRAVGACMIDQFIPDNPLSMGAQGFESHEKGATTGAERVVLDGLEITGPEAVAEHLERFEFPRLRKAAAEFDEARRTADILRGEAAVQATLGPDILKAPYAVARFPCFRYGAYGYAPYFMAYALYPEVMERDFSLQADLALRNNRAVARAYREGNLPPLLRLDHDMADSRGTLVDVRSLDRLWFPHFTRCLEPLVRSDVRLIWHCDGNLMEMVPRLLDVGLRGFQGFQYECGMDYERICRMKAKDGSELVILAGVSVSTTLPYGTPDDVRRELRWLVEAGPRTGLFLGASSSITPGVPWHNLRALVEGLAYYRARGRS